MADFADMIYLFSSNKHSRGACRLNIAEAAELWKRAAKARIGILEIGRFKGGSTQLIDTNKKFDIPFISIDKEQRESDYTYAYSPWTTIVVADSQTYEYPQQLLYDLAFIDGDHSYEGVKADWTNLKLHLIKNATILLHDVFSETNQPGVNQFVEELLMSKELTLLYRVDSMAVCFYKGTN